MSAETQPTPDAESRLELLRRLLNVTRSVTNPHVQGDFRLVPEQSKEIQEYVMDRTGGRHLAVLGESDIVGRHARLLEARVPVLSGFYDPTNQLLIFDVPSGSRTIASYAGSIRRRPGMFAPLFEEIGQIMGQVESATGKTLSPSYEFPLLRQFVAVSDNESGSGGRTLLLPPYATGEMSRVDVLTVLHQELIGSRAVLPDQADYLVERVHDNWSA